MPRTANTGDVAVRRQYPRTSSHTSHWPVDSITPEHYCPLHRTPVASSGTAEATSWPVASVEAGGCRVSICQLSSLWEGTH